MSRKRDPEDVAYIEGQIIELRRARLDWRTIGAQVGLSHERARQIFNEAISRYPAERLDVMRTEEASLADEAIAKLREMVLDPAVIHRNKIEAWKVILGWSESKRRLFGLDAPVKREAPLLDTSLFNAKAIAQLTELENQAIAAEEAAVDRARNRNN